MRHNHHAINIKDHMQSKETIIPNYFGEKSSLYGCFHLADDSSDQPPLLICQPTGHEYERCHRAMRQLAIQATRKGISTLRFDYQSMGDSAGSCDDINLEQIKQDILQAIQHCCVEMEVPQLSVVGIRLGASLVAQLDTKEIETLVLYAPVLDGENLLAEWYRDHKAFLGKHSYASEDDVDADEILGFPVTADFKKELSQLFSPVEPSSSLKRVLFLVDESDIESPQLKDWANTYQQKGIQTTIEAVENIAIWKREPMDAIVPIKTIRRIVKWVAEGKNV